MNKKEDKNAFKYIKIEEITSLYIEKKIKDKITRVEIVDVLTIVFI